MGVLLVDNTVSGGIRFECDTISCKHCQAIIKVIISGVKKAAETKFRCERCRGPICRHCAEVLKGVCSPILAVVERALKTGKFEIGRHYEYKIMPH